MLFLCLSLPYSQIYTTDFLLIYKFYYYICNIIVYKYEYTFKAVPSS